MLNKTEVVDHCFLDLRSMLLEIAGTLDRVDRAAGSSGDNEPRLARVYRSLEILADRTARSDRAEQLLQLFSE